MNNIILTQSCITLCISLFSQCLLIASKVPQNNCFTSFTSLTVSFQDFPVQNPVKHQYYVIAGSYIVRQNALVQLEILHKNGFQNTSVRVFPESEYYSIVVDSFSSESSAVKLKQKLELRKFASFIKRLSL